MPDDINAAADRVARFIEGWNRLRRGGLHTDVVYSVGAHPDEDEGRELRTPDLELLVAVARRLPTPDELSRLAEYAGEVINARLDTLREDPAYDSNELSLARAAEAIFDRCMGWARCEVCGGSAPTADEIRHTDEDCFK